MNKGIYRLVFNALRGMWMAVEETARSMQRGSQRLRRRSVTYLLTLLFAGPGYSVFAAELAPDVLPDINVHVGPNTVIHAPVINPLNDAGRLMVIQQGDLKAILQGPSFNIGNASEVRFNHTAGAGSATLVRVIGNERSIIEGKLTAPNGDIYLLNQNGILFGDGARVNVHGLVASTLNLSDSDFLNDLGHLYAITQDRAAYVFEGDADGFAQALVQVEPNARIKAELGGSVMLFGSKVINKGSIETTEGQVAMAAGSKVYLSFAPDPNSTPGSTSSYSYASDSPYRSLAGLLVEVDPYQEKSGDTVTREITGEVVNDTMGRILAERGNVTMASFMVNQLGRVTATTSASQKGSIRLLARDQSTTAFTPAYDQNGNVSQQEIIAGTRTGKLTLGENSVTMILPEHAAGIAIAKQQLGKAQSGEPAAQAGEKSYLSSVVAALSGNKETITDEQIFSAPVLEAVGRTVTLKDNAKVIVPGGFINISAQKNGAVFNDVATTAEPDTRIYLGKNTLVDASGLKGVAVDSDRNFIKVLLTLNDLKDDPLNKNGFLYRKEVWVDIRDLPNSRVADLSGYLKQVPRDIGEKLATAGSVSLKSEGDVVQREGSVIDVSGGSLKYSAGNSKESWLVDVAGNAYAIGDAPANVKFTGFLGGQSYRSVAEAAYTEGKAAGTISINSFGLTMDGAVKGGATYGQYQRGVDNLAGSLILGNANGYGSGSEIYKLQAVTIGKAATKLDETFNEDSTLPTDRQNTATLDASMLNAGGFGKVKVYSEGAVNVDSKLAVGAGGEVALTGQQVNVNADIVARGGDISLKTRLTQKSSDLADSSINIGKNATLDVSGLWVNDYLVNGLPTARILSDGGNISISSIGDVTIEKGSLLDVSGGAWMNQKAKVSAGDAGSISIAAQAGQDVSNYRYVAPDIKGELRGYALGRGGSLDITAPFVTVGAEGFGDAREFVANAAFFRTGGFTSYSLTGRDGVVVREGTNVNVIAKNYFLDTDALTTKSGGHLHDIASVVQLPDYMRYSTSLALSTQYANGTAPYQVAPGSVVVEKGATLAVDGRASYADSHTPTIALTAWQNQLYVDGTLKAPGGDIILTMNGDPGRPNPAGDNGYVDSQAIWLGSNARLLANGYARYEQNGNGLQQANVFDGGSVTLNAKKGYVVTEKGSLINVAGSSATVDVLANTADGLSYSQASIRSSAGDVNLSAREGMLIDGGFNAKSPTGLGGTLNVSLGRGTSTFIDDPLATYPGTSSNDPNQLWYVSLSQSGEFASALNPGDAIEAAAPGLAKISADNIKAGGFGSLGMKSEYGMRFDGDVNLSLARALNIDARVIEATPDANVNITAPVVSLTNTDVSMRPSNSFTAPTPVAGTADLNINAMLLDLRGNLSLSGFEKANLNSTGDVRLTGYSTATSAPMGSLKTNGELNFTARQIYPTSLTTYTIAAEGANSKVSFNGNGTPTTVLSAGGVLNVQAATIEQGGVLKAPLGTINLQATQELILKSGSLTSVSAKGALIPFGYTDQDGQDYLYDFGAGQIKVTTPPEKIVNLSAPTVTQSSGSVVDISGGGDLYGYEWVAGTGGSTDVLANGADQAAFGNGATQTWAVIPAGNQKFGSYDTQYYQGSDLQAGDAVYLSGGSGLPAGYYTLLPARYALLPGAYLVTAVEGYQDMVASQSEKRMDGATVVSGHLAAYTANGYVQTDRTAGFAIRAGSAARQLAEYRDTLGSEKFASQTQSQQLGDAGRLAISADQNMVLEGILKSEREKGKRGAEVDIAAPKLAVVNDGDAPVSGYLTLSEKTLANLNADSLLLGGTRSANSNGQAVNVTAGEVLIANGAKVEGPEVILAANNEVRVANGGQVLGAGTANAGKNLTIGSSTVDGDGALLRVSTGNAVTVTRNNINRDRGILALENGSTVNGSGAVQMDATKNVQIEGGLALNNNAQVGLSAGRISLGTPNAGSVVDGLSLTDDMLAALSQVKSLNLTSYSTIDFYGGLNMGSATQDISLNAAGLAWYENAGLTSNITAKQLTLGNENNVAFVAAPALSNGQVPVLGTGSLNMQADKIVTGNNGFQLAGLSNSNLSSAGDIVATGNGSLSSSGNMTLAAQRITAQGVVTQTYTAQNVLNIAQNGTPATSTVKDSTGATLSFNGTSINHQGSIDLPAGKVNMTASAGDVNLQDGSRIIANGSGYTLNGQTVPLAAGTVSLQSNTGNINMSADALVDVSSSAGGDAGKLNLNAKNGTVNLQGDIKANQVADSKGKLGAGAAVTVDAGNVSDFSNMLEKLGDFAGAQNYRVRNGDVAIAATDSVKTANFVLAADNGAINVAGKIDASGDKGGNIALYAKNNTTLTGTGQLLAKGMANAEDTAGTLGRGGKVLLASENGTVSAASGALIDVSGDQAGTVKGANGEVVFRAARVGNNAVNVDSGAAAAVKGGSVTVEAVKTYQATTINTALQNTINNDSAAFLANASSLAASYAQTQDGRSVTFTPGAEIRSNGDLTLANAWDLSQRTVLTLRAAGNLNINQNLTRTQYNGFGATSVPSTEEASYRLIAGADLNAVNLQEVNEGTGNLTIAANRQVYTGTGDIEMSAGNNIVIGSNAAVFTTGVPNNDGLNGSQSVLPNDTLEFYARNGGDINLNAGGDITGLATTTQTANRWFYRGALRLTNGAYVNPQLRWWPRFDKLQNTIGTLGGGDLTVNAAGSVNNLQFAAASNGRMTGSTSTAASMANFFEQGGGDVTVTAGNDINNALLFASKGLASAAAGDSLNAKFELMNASAKARAGGDLSVSVANPTVVAPVDRSRSQYSAYFYSFAKDGELNAVSAAGDVNLTGELYPANLYAAAAGGDVTTSNFVIYPSAKGNVTLLAKNNVTTSLIMSDTDPSSIPQVATAPVYSLDSLQRADSAGNKSSILATYVGSLAHTPGNLHAADTEPARFYAGNDVIFKPFNSVIIPKRTEVIAGNDVVNPNLIIQNLKASDISLIKAGGSIRYTDGERDSLGRIFAVVAGVQIAGPGRLHLEAGKDIDLGSSDGIRSVGNLYNPYLAEVGATLMVKPGATAVDYTTMIATYLESGSAASNTYLTQLLAYMKGRGADADTTREEALTAFKLLSTQEQTEFINSIFFQEIKAGGRDAIASGSGDYSRALRAILLMFPDFTSNKALASKPGNIMKEFEKISQEAISHPGDLKLFYSQIRSESSGDIELLVPGGDVNAGLAVSGTLLKPATDLGIVSIRGGEINAVVRNNFQVNQSRVFTLGGSDLMLISALQNIDAGRGAKTSSATPPPVLRIRDGQIFFDYSGAVSGSGIAALTATGGKPGTVDLFAPFGEIDAGEAGIRSAGNINLGAKVIIGADNISAGGVTAGASTTTVTAPAVGFTPAADPSTTGKSTEQASNLGNQMASAKNSFLPSFISVEVIGYGNESPADSSKPATDKNEKNDKNKNEKKS